MGAEERHPRSWGSRSVQHFLENQTDLWGAAWCHGKKPAGLQVTWVWIQALLLQEPVTFGCVTSAPGPQCPLHKVGLRSFHARWLCALAGEAVAVGCRDSVPPRYFTQTGEPRGPLYSPDAEVKHPNSYGKKKQQFKNRRKHVQKERSIISLWSVLAGSGGRNRTGQGCLTS